MLLLACALGGFACGGDDDDASGGAAGSGNAGGSGNTADQCHDGCVATLAADCDNGPATQTQCESDCKGFVSSACASEYTALQTCAEGKAITCNSAGLPTITGCSSQTAAFVSCLN